MGRFEEGLFPVRFLGFGLFWAWLFIVGLSPSPLFENPPCFGGLPFELFEVLMRCLAIVASLALSRFIATDHGKFIYIGIGAIAGLAVTPLMLWGSGETVCGIAAILAAIAEVVLFLMWLSFFGATRLGDTLTLLVLSYGIGAVFFLGTLIGGRNALIGASLLFPVLSAVALVFSGRLVAHRKGIELFNENSNEDDAESAISGLFSRKTLVQDPSAWKMTAALTLYSLAFSLLLSMTFTFASTMTTSYLIESVSILVLAGIYIIYMLFAHNAAKPYVLYRGVAPAMGIGFALLASSFAPLIGGSLVMIGYLLFEVLALNDFCNLV